MAAAANKSRKPTDPAEKTGKPRGPLLIMAVVAVLAASAAGGGVWFYTSKNVTAPTVAAAAPPAPAQYFALEPAFVVNLNGSIDGPRYLQVEAQLMTRDPLALQQLQTHAPAIRARLLMLFSQVEPEQIVDRTGKEKLRADALKEVQAVMKSETGKNGADELLFTSFVTQ